MKLKETTYLSTFKLHGCCILFTVCNDGRPLVKYLVLVMYSIVYKIQYINYFFDDKNNNDTSMIRLLFLRDLMGKHYIL